MVGHTLGFHKQTLKLQYTCNVLCLTNNASHKETYGNAYNKETYASIDIRVYVKYACMIRVCVVRLYQSCTVEPPCTAQ